MGEFFKPWRRKIGCVTLIMACVFAAGWVRSLAIADVSDLSGRYLPKTTSFFQMASTSRGIEFRRIWPKRQGDYSNRSWGWRSSPIQQEVRSRDFEFEVEWAKSLCGVGIEGGSWGKPYMRPGLMRIMIIHYWSIVIPLTLISSWLLLSKPRTTNVKPISEPVPETAT